MGTLKGQAWHGKMPAEAGTLAVDLLFFMAIVFGLEEFENMCDDAFDAAEDAMKRHGHPYHHLPPEHTIYPNVRFDSTDREPEDTGSERVPRRRARKRQAD